MEDFLMGFGVGATVAAIFYMIFPKEQRWINPKILLPAGIVILAVGAWLKYG